MKSIILFLSLVFSFSVFAQSDKVQEKFINVSQINGAKELTCNQIEELAKSDIEKGFIIILHGNRTQAITNETDHNYEKNYSLSFFGLGCMTPSYDCIKKYNWVMFDYLKVKYGNDWLKKTRNDLVGLDEWIKN